MAAGGWRLTVQVMPNAKKTEIVGVVDDALKIRLQAPPVEGKANEALVRYLAEKLDVAKSAVSLIHGHTGRRKIVGIAAEALKEDELRDRLGLGGELRQ
jgi:uncharacterized protein (TIGR00251 family)